jgi:HTH-type transcriptional regulator/antitoxin MqsA
MSNKCQICGSESIKEVIKDEEFCYKDNKLVIPDYKSVICENCGESVADKQSYEDSIPILRDFHRKVDGFLTCEEIKSIRKSFQMTQDSFSELLGGGEKAFARYETGKVMQSKPMDNLLRILREYPEAVGVLSDKPIKKREFAVFKGDEITYKPTSVIRPFEYLIDNNNWKKLG